MALRIGINALYLIPGGVGGTEIYLGHLLEALATIDGENRYFVFTNRETSEGFVPARPNFRSVPQPVDAVNRPARLLWEQTGLALAVLECRLDVLFNAGFTAPVVCPCPQVTMFHDLHHERLPEDFGRVELLAWRFFLWAAARRSRILITPSASSRDDLVRCYGLRPEQVRVVPEGVDPAFFEIARERQAAALAPYLLCASTSHRHKGLVALVRAFARVRREHPEFRLVITGVPGNDDAAVRGAIELEGLGGSVQLTGWLSREELYKRFRHAFAFVYPSTFEGFGLPVLEALAAGIPTACSAIEPLTTLAGDAALTFPPRDETALAKALLRLIGDEPLRERLSAAGPPRARQFPWEQTARLTLEALDLGGS